MYDETASTGARPLPSAETSPDSQDPHSAGIATRKDPHSDPRETLGGTYVGPPVIREALLNSFRDGLLANGMLALQETFVIAAAVSLRASSMAIASMTSLSLLLGALSQFLVPAFADPAKGRKHYVIVGVYLQAFCFFLAAFTGFLPAEAAPWAFAGMFVLSVVSNQSTGAYWTDWMGDLIPGSVRGRHFAWRSIWFQWTYLACSLTAGIFARKYTSANAPWLLFCFIFLAAAALRYGCAYFLKRQYEPVSHTAREALSPFKFRPSRDFLYFCVATSAFGGAAAMSGPFFAVWYLRDLHFNYLTVAVAHACTVLGSIAFIKFWGRMVDNFGTSKVIWVSGLMATVIPLPYLFFSEPHQIWLANLYSGATWSGYNMALFNHILNATDTRQRNHFIAFGTLVGGVLGFGFTLLGGFLATRLPALNGYTLRSLFLLSACLRLVICLAAFRGIREYREALPRRRSDVLLELPGGRISHGLFRSLLPWFRSQ